MSFEKIQAPSTRELLIRQIQEKIVSGELPAGTKLPAEREMAEQMGVTKSVLHFALKELESMKFLHSIPRHGTYVSDWISYGNFETLNAVLSLKGSSSDDELVSSLIDIRNVIEADAMMLCSARCSEGDYRELQASIDALRALPDDSSYEEQAAEIKNFHFMIIRKSGNLMYPMIMNAFDDFAMLLWVRCVTHWSKDALSEFEQQQLDMIKSGHAEQAGQMIKDMFAEYRRIHGKPY